MVNKNQPIMFSIILPTYNVAEHIDRCLKSCISQSYSDFEIVIVDDCGSDDSVKKAEVWAERDSRIKIVKNSRNLGTFHSRRRGVEEAKGGYIVFLDPDDTIESNTLELIGNAIGERPVDMILYGAQEIPAKNRSTLTLPEASFSNEELLRNVLLECKFFGYGTAGKAFSREVLCSAYKVINADINDRLVYGEDALLFYAVALSSGSSVSVPKALYLYCREPGSITRQKSDQDIRFKSRQIYLVSSYVYKILHSQADRPEVAEIAGKKVVGKLLSDAALVKRYMKSRDGSSLYLKSVIESVRMRGGVADLIRMICYVLTFGCVRF